MHDKRITARLSQYWELIRGDAPMPKIHWFNSSAVEEVWPQCFTVSVKSRHGIAYKYEYMGKAAVDAYGQDLTGLTVDHKATQFPGSVVIKELDKVVKQQKLDISDGHLLNKDGRLIKYRASFLPFGNKKGLTHIIVGLSFRAF